MRAVAPFMDGVVLDPAKSVDALQALLRPGDRVALEGTTRNRRISSPGAGRVRSDGGA